MLAEAMQLHVHLRRAVRLVDDAGFTVDWGLLNGEIELSDDAGDDDLVSLAKARGLYRMLRERVVAIEDLGGEVKGVVDGLVDFASWRDGETEVWLCWKIGEETITHYHEVDSGLAGRRPVGDHNFSATRDRVDVSAER